MMPACFVKEYGVHIDDYVMLRDPNKNLFEVRAVKRDGNIYFTDGWIAIRDFYKLDFGARIRLTYAEPNLMLMTLRNRSGMDIEYPVTNPPTVSRLSLPVVECSRMRFRCSSVHILSKADIESGFLVSDP